MSKQSTNVGKIIIGTNFEIKFNKHFSVKFVLQSFCQLNYGETKLILQNKRWFLPRAICKARSFTPCNCLRSGPLDLRERLSMIEK